MQRSAVRVLRNLGNAFRLTTDETVLRSPKFARHLNPDLAYEEEQQHQVEQQPACRPSDGEHPSTSGALGGREQEDSPGTSYSLPHLRADIEQQRYPVSALHALVGVPSCMPSGITTRINLCEVQHLLVHALDMLLPAQCRSGKGCSIWSQNTSGALCGTRRPPHAWWRPFCWAYLYQR